MINAIRGDVKHGPLANRTHGVGLLKFYAPFECSCCLSCVSSRLFCYLITKIQSVSKLIELQHEKNVFLSTNIKNVEKKSQGTLCEEIDNQN